MRRCRATSEGRSAGAAGPSVEAPTVRGRQLSVAGESLPLDSQYQF
jgi:hypothetical protein